MRSPPLFTNKKCPTHHCARHEKRPSALPVGSKFLRNISWFYIFYYILHIQLFHFHHPLGTTWIPLLETCTAARLVAIFSPVSLSTLYPTCGDISIKTFWFQFPLFVSLIPSPFQCVSYCINNVFIRDFILIIAFIIFGSDVYRHLCSCIRWIYKNPV